jgi:hypothetical protein
MTQAAALIVEREKDFASWFEDALRLHGWMWHHCEASWSRGRIRTAITGQPGFPDYVCAHPERGQLFVAELKSADGALSADQRAWKHVLADCVEYHVFRPQDRDQIMDLLKGDT